MARFLIGSLLSLGTFFFAFWIEGGNPLSFFLFSPSLIVLLVPLFAVLAVWSFRELGGALRAAFAARPSEAEGKAAAALWDFYEKAFYAAGLFGTLAGFIIIFRNAEIRMEVFSIALMPLVEGILLGLVARILRARVEKNARAS
jgi:hypothetical protein